jgi:hypothetical protein
MNETCRVIFGYRWFDWSKKMPLKIGWSKKATKSDHQSNDKQLIINQLIKKNELINLLSACWKWISFHFFMLSEKMTPIIICLRNHTRLWFQGFLTYHLLHVPSFSSYVEVDIGPTKRNFGVFKHQSWCPTKQLQCSKYSSTYYQYSSTY